MMRKYLTFVCCVSLLLSSNSTFAAVKEKLVDNYDTIKRAEDFVSAKHISGQLGSEMFLKERLKEINRLRLALKNRNNNPENTLKEVENLTQKEEARFKRGRSRLADSVKTLSAQGVAAVEAYGKDFIKYKDGKEMRISKGRIVSIDNEKVYDKRGNKYVRNTTDILYDDLNRIIAYREETFSPDGQTKTVLLKSNTVYYTADDEQSNYRAMEGQPASFTEVTKTYNAETGAYISGSKKDWSSLLYYGKDDNQGNAGYLQGQMSSYTVTEYVNPDSNAIGAVTKTAELKYVHRLKYINELTVGGQVADSDLKDEERYEYLVTGYKENYKPVQFSGSEQTTVLDNIQYNDYGEFYSYTEKISNGEYTLTRTVKGIEYDSLGNVVNVDDETSYTFETLFFEQFSRDYSTDELFSDTAVQNQFITEFLTLEGAFHQAGVSYSAENGMTYDSYNLNADTGNVIGGPNTWSAASNESLHINILAAAIAGDVNAATFISPDDPSQGAAKALEILTLKIATLEQFYTANPKYAGFLPWFTHNGAVIQPSGDWTDRVPSLDNGQLAWALMMTEKVLLDAGETALSNRYRVYWQRMANNAKTVFFDGTDKIYGEAKITDAGPGAWTYSDNVPGYALDDAYEGEIMVLFMSLFSTLTPAEVNAIWTDKTMSSATYTTAEGDNITVRQGHWYSSHEMWNFFVLPYTDDPLIAEVFRLGEIARTAYSAENLIPGLYASVNPPGGVTHDGASYASNCGIASLAAHAIKYPYIVTPYASFPVIVADQGAGLSWLANMLQGAKAQGPYGTTESINTDGTSIANILTWDAKALLVNSLAAGTIQSSIRTVMQDKGVYADFLSLLNTEYTDTFTNLASLQGSHLSFFKPTQALPRPSTVNDFYDTVNIFQGASVGAGGTLEQWYTFDSSTNTLTMRDKEGFVYINGTPVDLSVNSILSLNVATNDNADVWIEVKNTDSQLITGEKFRMFMPNTGGAFKTFSIDLSSLIATSDTNMYTIVFMDPSKNMTINNIFAKSSSMAGMNFLKAESGAYEFFRTRSIVDAAHEQTIYTPASRVNTYLSDTGGYTPRILQEVSDILFDAEASKPIISDFALPVLKTGSATSETPLGAVKQQEEEVSYNQDFDDRVNNAIEPVEYKVIPVYTKGSSKHLSSGKTVK